MSGRGILARARGERSGLRPAALRLIASAASVRSRSDRSGSGRRGRVVRSAVSSARSGRSSYSSRSSRPAPRRATPPQVEGPAESGARRRRSRLGRRSSPRPSRPSRPPPDRPPEPRRSPSRPPEPRPPEPRPPEPRRSPSRPPEPRPPEPRRSPARPPEPRPPPDRPPEPRPPPSRPPEPRPPPDRPPEPRPPRPDRSPPRDGEPLSAGGAMGVDPTGRASERRGDRLRSDGPTTPALVAVGHRVGYRATVESGSGPLVDGLRRNRPQNALERGPEAPLAAFEIRRRPTLPGTLVPSTIGAGGLNCRVQNGNGCDPAAIATENRLRPCRRTGTDTILLSRAANGPLQYSTANTNIDNDCRCVTKPSAD